ncbi:MAG: c-type cytochrome [Bacteriovoracaceae bacterium]|nr:c-type cytochrome [Bacteriovoracaceae bacterium]
MNNTEEKIEVKEDEKHLLLDHNYDNIQELNHPLPSWWNTIWAISIVFSIGYFVYYQFMGGPTLVEEFQTEYSEIIVKQTEFKRKESLFDDSYYQKIIADGGLEKGKEVYEINCLPCHLKDGVGDTGPNLTDDYWLIAKGTPESIYSVIFNGSEENGMPIWSEVISKDEIYQAVSYVMTFKNTFKKGKKPQGEKIVDK